MNGDGHPPIEGRIRPDAPPDEAAMCLGVEALLRGAGFPVDAEPHLRETARRVAEAWSRDLLGGYRLDPQAALGEPFPDEGGQMVVVSDIEFFSSCPHHLMPYRGTAHIGYVPDRLAVGFSGVVRLLDALAHRLTLQEWLTRDVTAVLDRVLAPRGAACVVQAAPMCVIARGVKRPCEIVSTSFTGVFREDPEVRRDFLASALERRR